MDTKQRDRVSQAVGSTKEESLLRPDTLAYAPLLPDGDPLWTSYLDRLHERSTFHADKAKEFTKAAKACILRRSRLKEAKEKAASDAAERRARQEKEMADREAQRAGAKD